MNSIDIFEAKNWGLHQKFINISLKIIIHWILWRISWSAFPLRISSPDIYSIEWFFSILSTELIFFTSQELDTKYLMFSSEEKRKSKYNRLLVRNKNLFFNFLNLLTLTSFQRYLNVFSFLKDSNDSVIQKRFFLDIWQSFFIHKHGIH